MHNTLQREQNFFHPSHHFTVDETRLALGHPSLSVEDNRTLFGIVYAYIAETNHVSYVCYAIISNKCNFA